MLKLYPRSFENLKRYLFATGTYPYRISIKSPLGLLQPTLGSYHDLLTVSEIFCREDYRLETNSRHIVDIGANIGLSALYFLSRNPETFCYLYEPVPKNVGRLKENLQDFSQRAEVFPYAVDVKSGSRPFRIDPSGRYGTFARDFEDSITVECLDVNTVLESTLKKASQIDLLKIDTEGTELALVKAIRPEYLKKIRAIFLEWNGNEKIHEDLFQQSQYGGICRLIRRD